RTLRDTGPDPCHPLPRARSRTLAACGEGAGWDGVAAGRAGDARRVGKSGTRRRPPLRHRRRPAKLAVTAWGLSGLKVLVQHLYPGRSRNKGVAHGTVSTIAPHGARGVESHVSRRV